MAGLPNLAESEHSAALWFDARSKTPPGPGAADQLGIMSRLRKLEYPFRDTSEFNTLTRDRGASKETLAQM